MALSSVWGVASEILQGRSVKATSEVYSGVSGEVVAFNDAAVNDPSVLNSDPFGNGWLIKVKVADSSNFDALLDHVAYSEKFPD